MTDPPRAWPKISIGCSVRMCVWLVALIVICALNVLQLMWAEDIIANPPDDLNDWLLPGETLDAPQFYIRWLHYAARGIVGISIMATAVVLFTTLYAIVCRRASRVMTTSLYAAIPLGFAPLIVRVLLPWENPWTGAGSPVFVFMLAPFYILLFGAPVAIWGRHFIRAVQPDSSGDAVPDPSRDELSLPTPLDQM